jgi:hypothetical protein
MADFVLYNSKLRVYRNGTVERLFKKWRVCELKPMANGYYRLTINKVNVLLHRLIGACFLGLDINNSKQEIDHINRLKSDNRVENLRIVTRQENCWNVKGKGYIWSDTHKKFVAHIKLNNKFINLGYYDNPIDARQSYVNGKLKYHNLTISSAPC